MSDKFTPVDVPLRPCSAADREAHLRAFANSFVVKERRARCIHILVERPDKAGADFYRIREWIDAEVSRQLEGANGFPQCLQRDLGSSPGVYVDSRQRCLLLAPAEAATLAARDSVDAILSLAPGKRALFFFHEGGVYRCDRS